MDRLQSPGEVGGSGKTIVGLFVVSAVSGGSSSGGNSSFLRPRN